MESNEFQTAVRWWLGVGVGRTVCPFCQDVALDPLGHHAVTCRHGGDVVIRHNHLRGCLCGLLPASSSECEWVLQEITATPDLQMYSLLGGTGASLQLLMSL